MRQHRGPVAGRPTGRGRRREPGSRPARPPGRAGVTAVLAAALGCVLAGCAAPAPAGTVSASTALPAGASWLLTRSALAQLVTDPAVGAMLARSRIYEILRPGQQLLPGVRALAVVTFPAVAPLAAALADGRLPAGTRAVLYDPEAWSFTPSAEQRDPAGAAATAARLAHSHGLQLIAAPALNLTTVLAPGSPAPRWRTFLSLRLAAEVARSADIIELQAQSLERDLGTYVGFVRSAAQQARAANQRVTVLAGLSTNPPGPPVSGRQLAAAMQASRPAVAGYWLNIPGRGPRCPTCNMPRPDIGISALHGIAQAIPSAGSASP